MNKKIPDLTREELEDLTKSLYLRIKNQKKHLRWFNKFYQNFNAGKRHEQKFGSPWADLADMRLGN